MSNSKAAGSWQETKATIRRYYLRFGGLFRSIEDASLEDRYDFASEHQWSTGNIKSFIRATKLCQECSGVFSMYIVPKETHISGCYSHHDSYNDLLRCANSGCRVCVRLVEKAQVWSFANRNGDRYNNQPCILWRYRLHKSHWFEFLIGAPTCEAESELQSLWTIYKEEFHWMNPFINPAPTLRVPDPSPAAYWIQECASHSHEECQRYRAQAAQDLHRPRRLLRLCEYQPETVQLVEDVDIRDDPYVTLSHRWGSPDPPKLSATRDDANGRIAMLDLKSGVSFSRLPRTFRDALNIVSRCGLRYLWIDSMCILQDKDADGRNPDWEREAANVGDIYAGAIFNIAALNGSNSDSGLFPKRQKLLVPVIRNFTGRQARKVFHKLRYDVEETSTVLCDEDDKEFNEAILDSELLSRGWVFQEVFLTPANLFCTSEQMWWSCSHASFSQIFPRGRLESFYTQKPVVDGLRAKKAALMVPDDCTDPIKAWMEALMYYTGTSVTYGDDRLAAISGIANTFRALFPAQFGDASYHSGVWSIELVRQLGWHRVSTEDPPGCRFATNHYMPSWSPAGFKGRVFQYGTYTKDALPIEFISLDTSEVDSFFQYGPHTKDALPIKFISLNTSEVDSFGRAKEAKQSVLHLRGVPVEMTLEPRSEELAAWPTGYPYVKVDLLWDSLAEMNSAREDSASYRSLALYGSPDSGEVEGLLLRNLQVSKDSAGEPCNRWVRCAWFRWNFWKSGYTSYLAGTAFQFERYGLTWGKLKGNKFRKKRREDVFIV